MNKKNATPGDTYLTYILNIQPAVPIIVHTEATAGVRSLLSVALVACCARDHAESMKVWQRA